MSRRISSIVKSAKAQDRNSEKTVTKTGGTDNFDAFQKNGDKNRENRRRDSASRRSENKSPKSLDVNQKNNKAQKGRPKKNQLCEVRDHSSSTHALETTISRESNERYRVFSLGIDGSIESITPVEFEKLLVIQVRKDQQLILIEEASRNDGLLRLIGRVSTDEVIRISIRFFAKLLWWTAMLLTGLVIAKNW